MCRLLALCFRFGFVMLMLMGPNGSNVPSWPWYSDASDAAHHDLVREMDQKVQAAAWAGTAEDAFVICPNRTPTRAEDAVEYRYKGADRIARLGASKRQWAVYEGFL
ncbi:hypothetical protein B0H14DRAFT_2649946 [Mycena olivaceomarginata]|nr:hypothetical protein B0H14DRAFT_2649946 [Mycena olivaceomarginata]